MIGTPGLLCRLAVLSTDHVQVGCRPSPCAIGAVPPMTAVASAVRAASRRPSSAVSSCSFPSSFPLAAASARWIKRPVCGAACAPHHSLTRSFPLARNLANSRSDRFCRDETTCPCRSSCRPVRRPQPHERADPGRAARGRVGLVDSGAFVNGPAVGSFEEAFAAYCRTSDAVGLASGLDALRLALLAAGIRPGDEVIVPAQTFVATLEAVTQAGGTPVPAEIGGRLQPRSGGGRGGDHLAHAFLLPVHLYGQMADMQGAPVARERRGLAIVEDACQAHGAERDGFRAGAAGSPARSASTRPRTSARWATPARSPRTTRASPRRCARCASTVSAGSTTTTSRATRLASTRSRRSCSS